MNPPRAVHVEGDGLAASACGVLLRRSGWIVSGEPPALPAVPFLVLDAAAARVVSDIFGRLPSGTPCRRVVVHHHRPAIAQPGIQHLVVPSTAILDLMPAIRPASPNPDGWRISTSGGSQPDRITSGSRVAWIFDAAPQLSPAASHCVFEFTPEGWVFWAPTAAREGFLQFVTPSAVGGEDACRVILERTRLLRDWVTCGAISRHALPCAASASTCFAEGRTLSCGAAALRYDPISGDGTGASLRSAILACAVLERARTMAVPAPVFDHLRARIGRAFVSHLNICERFYRDAELSRMWNGEQGAMREAITLSDAVFTGLSATAFRIREFALEPV